MVSVTHRRFVCHTNQIVCHTIVMFKTYQNTNVTYHIIYYILFNENSHSKEWEREKVYLMESLDTVDQIDELNETSKETTTGTNPEVDS